MQPYKAPLADMNFLMRHMIKLDHLFAHPQFEDLSLDLVEDVLEQAGRFSEEVLAPLNQIGDAQGVAFENGSVRTAPGFREAYEQFVEAGWQSLPVQARFGGQGLPWTVQVAVTEMLNAANMSFALAPLLTQGAIEALEIHGSPEQQATYLPHLVTGRWNGTMNLTEPQAGTDVGSAKTKAILMEDGTYRLKGSKIFITWGENDCAENTVHLVLARLPDAPAGSKGISLFIVPKFLVKADGSLGARNDVRCAGVEHKMGIHGSPTCVMSYGDREGAVGYLVGQPHCGMQYMFTMMNSARLSVGVQGLAIAERAYQGAVAFAKERRQSAALGSKDKSPVAIIEHPDVRRNLLLMKTQLEAMRGLAYLTLYELDISRLDADTQVSDARRQEAQGISDLLVPIIKSWCTDKGVEIASLAVQVHGGMGFIEETGAAQHFRDARILPIYEGTNGVQALDLMGRKTFRDQGKATRLMLERMDKTYEKLDVRGQLQIAHDISQARCWVEQGLDAMLVFAKQGQILQAAAGATAYQELLSICFGAWIMAERLLAKFESGASEEEHEQQSLSARFFMAQILSKAPSLLRSLKEGQLANEFDEAAF